MSWSAARMPFIAREAEIASLLAAVGRAADGEPGLVLLGADAGVGKTRLLDQVSRLVTADGGRVVTGHCIDLGGIGLPYLPFVEVLRRLTEDPAPEVSAVVTERPALGRLLPGGTGPEEPAERLQLFDGVAALLAAAGRAHGPLVVVLEDLHWADASSRDLLRFLVARLRTEPVLLVGSYRADDLHRRHPLRPVLADLGRHPRVERIDLAPFDTAELRAFTTALTGAPLPEEALRRIERRSEGNAYFAEELTEAGTTGAELPETLAEVLRARVEDLEPATRRLVRTAAAAGRRVSEPLLRAVALPGDDVDAALREAVAHHVLVGEDDRVAFRHALLAEAVYADLLPGEQVALHRDYLRAIAEQPTLGTAAERAHHALLARDDRSALSAAREAATEAARLLAPDEELRHLETVLRLWPAVPSAADELGTDRVRLLLTAAAAGGRAGLTTRAVQLAREAVDSVTDDPELMATAEIALARQLLAAERADDALAATTRAEAAIAHAGDALGAVRAWVLATRARAALNADQDDLGEAAAAAAVTEARAAGAVDAEADALISLAVLVVDDPERAAELLRSALDLARRSGDRGTELRCTYNLAANRFYAGELVEAATVTEAGLALAVRTGLSWSPYGLELRLFQEIVRYARGDLSPGDPAGSGPVPATAALEGVRMYAAVARGDAGAVERALDLLHGPHEDTMITLIAGGCAVDALTWAGRPEEAVALARRLIDEIGRVWSHVFLGGIWLSALALAALADLAALDRLAGRDPTARLTLGDDLLGRADRTAERGRPRGGPLGPEGRAWLARAHAEHARLHGDRDPTPWATATASFGYGYRYEEARTRWRWAEALLVSGDREAAQREATEAWATARAIAAGPLVTAVADLARRGRLDLPGMAVGAGSVLTARESEVLALAAAGLSNRQIGERMYISAKTVSVHMSRVLDKLGASGRAEAVSIGHRRGLIES
ncbi:helix-turn-helix transcriptional regulator [Cellulomonas taurus]|uniref:helix-turn-helix transcriptional regulator n=1 Tax=Cellulomonas taurus TaxID=2729175 RepID=UPI001FEC4C19|nr:AAA family ATPase [Cellulomonas taurus]